MSQPKLITLLDHLDQKEKEHFRKALLLNYEPQSQIIALYDLISKTKDCRESNSTAEQLSFVLLHKENVKLISNYLSELYIHLEDWISRVQLNQEPFTRDLLIQKWLNDKGIYNVSDQIVRRQFKKLGNNNLDTSISKAKTEILYEHLFSNHPAKYNMKSNDYSELIQSFHEYITVKAFILFIELINRAEVAHLAIEFQKSSLQKIIDAMPNTNLTSLLLHLKKLIEQNDFESYTLLKEALMNNTFQTGTKLHSIVTNYVVRRSMKFWSQGLLKDPKLIYEMAAYGMEHGVYLTSGKIGTATFHNLVGQLCQALSKAEMHDFVNRWIHKIHTKNVEATKSLADSQIAFYFHDYDSIYEHTFVSGLDDFNQKNISTSLHLIACFMHRHRPNSYHTFKHTLERCRYFISKNKTNMSNHISQSFVNLIDFMCMVDEGKSKEIDLSCISPLLYRTWCNYVLNQNKEEQP